jgi:two-component system aerobic respiration control sensor histidine kinase ArcB
MKSISHDWQTEAFNSIINFSECAIICLTEKGEVIEFNPQAESIFSCRYADVINENFSNVCQEKEIDFPLDLQKIFSQNPQQKIIETRCIEIQKKIIRWHIYPIKANNEDFIFLYGNDITSNEHSRDLNNYTRYIINNLPHSIFWKNKNSVFLGCNQKFSDSAHLASPAEVIGKTDYDMPWGKEEAEKYIEDDKEIMKSGIPKLNYEEHQTTAKGNKIIVLVSKVPIYDEENKISGILCIYTDITERKQQEEELRLAKESSEIANQLKHDFIQNMEHDIRTPVAGIYSILSAFSEEETDPEKKQILTLTFNAAKELLDYCNGILEFSKLESGLVPIVSKKFNLKKLIDRIIAIEIPPTLVKKLQLTAEFSEDLPKIIISDQSRLQRILINLVSNAIKFTKEGFVKISVNVAAKKDDKNIILRITIEDTGIGMPEEKLNIIYEKFSRLHPSNRGVYKGFGLGLPTVKQLMDELDGEVDVVSQPGKGTTFALTLPVKLPLIEELLFGEENNE